MESAYAFGKTRPAITENGILAESISTNQTTSHYTCRFTRALEVSKSGGGASGTFDLEEGKTWNIMIAKDSFQIATFKVVI